MKIFSNKSKLIKYIYREKDLGFVPTMGAIHMGHASLVKKSINQCNKTIVSIFVNEPQFNRKNDFKKYPRLLNNDISILRKLKVDFLYLPSKKQIYPDGPNRNIKIHPLGKKLCGKFRKNHFESVADVIERFIKIIKPRKIYFGEKDMQQLKIIEHFIKKNYINVKVIKCKTVRENSGVALSSRNILLSFFEKKIASEVYKLLLNKKKYIIDNKLTLSNIKKQITQMGVNKIDYIKIININKLTKPYKKNRKYRIFVAYYLGKTRLIDNI